MVGETSTESVTDALESAFGVNPPEDPVADTSPPPQEATEETASDPAPESEPEFEIEVNGSPEVIRGADKIKEFLQKGVHGSRQFEENARTREALAAKSQALQMQEQFTNSIVGDLAELKALDQQLEKWEKVDIGAAFETDPLKAFQLKEQRDTLREQRAAKFNELSQKQQQFYSARSQAIGSALAAEESALLAKLPEWRNSEVAGKERQAIAKYLGQSGFTETEVSGLSDHRAVLLARKAMLYDQLQGDKTGKLKQAREAPPVVKPGVAANPSQQGRQAFKDLHQQVIKAGKTGNHRAQEEIALAAFNRAFK